MTHLRHLTVFVGEPAPGHYHWVLHESTHDASFWVDILDSGQSYQSWAEAFEAGCVELFKLAPDERIGPQTLGENEDADPVG